MEEDIHDMSVDELKVDDSEDQFESQGESSCIEADVKDIPAEKTNGEEGHVPFTEALVDNTLLQNNRVTKIDNEVERCEKRDDFVDNRRYMSGEMGAKE